MILNPNVEPDWAVERGHLVEKNVSKLSLEYLSLFLVQEVLALHAPFRYRLCNSVQELADARFSLTGPEASTKIFRSDNVSSGLRPERRGLDALLFENNLTLMIGNYGVPRFPFYRVIRMDARFRIASLVSEFPSRNLRHLMFIVDASSLSFLPSPTSPPHKDCPAKTNRPSRREGPDI